MTSVPLGKWFPLRIAQLSWWIWCCMCFRFNAIRQLPATESKRYGFWARHHENDTLAFVGIQWGEYIHIESRIRRRWLLKAGDRWGESEMEQWGHARNGSAVLSVTKLNAFKLSVKLKKVRAECCAPYQCSVNGWEEMEMFVSYVTLTVELKNPGILYCLKWSINREKFINIFHKTTHVNPPVTWLPNSPRKFQNYFLCVAENKFLFHLFSNRQSEVYDLSRNITKAFYIHQQTLSRGA